MKINRRSFLIASGAVATGVGVGAGGLALWPGQGRRPRRALQVLDERRFGVLAAVADRICPGGEGLPTAWELEVPEDVDVFLASSDPAVAADLSLGLSVLENALPGLLLDGRMGPFTAAGVAEQDRTLRRLSQSGISLRKTIYKGLLGLVTATYWGNPRVFPAVGYTPLDFTGWSPAPKPSP